MPAAVSDPSTAQPFQSLNWLGPRQLAPAVITSLDHRLLAYVAHIILPPIAKPLLACPCAHALACRRLCTGRCTCIPSCTATSCSQPYWAATWACEWWQRHSGFGGRWQGQGVPALQGQHKVEQENMGVVAAVVGWLGLKRLGHLGLQGLFMRARAVLCRPAKFNPVE